MRLYKVLDRDLPFTGFKGSITVKLCHFWISQTFLFHPCFRSRLFPLSHYFHITDDRWYQVPIVIPDDIEVGHVRCYPVLFEAILNIGSVYHVSRYGLEYYDIFWDLITEPQLQLSALSVWHPDCHWGFMCKWKCPLLSVNTLQLLSVLTLGTCARQDQRARLNLAHKI